MCFHKATQWFKNNNRKEIFFFKIASGHLFLSSLISVSISVSNQNHASKDYDTGAIKYGGVHTIVRGKRSGLIFRRWNAVYCQLQLTAIYIILTNTCIQISMHAKAVSNNSVNEQPIHWLSSKKNIVKQQTIEDDHSANWILRFFHVLTMFQRYVSPSNARLPLSIYLAKRLLKRKKFIMYSGVNTPF